VTVGDWEGGVALAGTLVPVVEGVLEAVRDVDGVTVWPVGT
jgi:hypothetical protein